MIKQYIKNIQSATLLSKGIYFFALLFFFSPSVCFAQNIGISTTGATPNVSALLDIDAAPGNNKGLLIPRVTLVSSTDAVTIATPATSLLVYHLGSVGLPAIGYYYNSGTTIAPVWVQLLNDGTAWNVLGNIGTTAGTNFLGTTDLKDLVFKTNNTEWMRILSNGNMGIGTTSPGAKLEVQGQIKVVDGLQGVGKVLTSDAAGLASWQTPTSGGGSGFSNMQVFTASGSFTIPAGITKIMVEVRGGGGGGAKGNSAAQFGQGGSGGGYGKNVFTVVPGTVYTVTVGAGGIGSSGGSCSLGGVGGTSSFGALISATGGGGGGGCGSSSTPGSSTAALNMTGQKGQQLFLSSPRNQGGLCGDGSTKGMGGEGTAFFGNDGIVGNVVVYW